MKYSLTFLFITLISLSSFGQSTIFTRAEISKARVYYNGAEISQHTEFDLPKGQSEIVISNIADQLDQNSIRIGSVDGLSILSVQFTNAYLDDFENAEETLSTSPLMDSIRNLEGRLITTDNEINTLEETIKLMDANAEKGNNSVQFSTVNEMNKWITYYQEKRLELKASLVTKSKKKEELQKRIKSLKSKLELGSESESKSSQGKLVLQVSSNKAVKASMSIDYLTQTAGWIPSYDLDISDIDSPIDIIYKADVRQNTGFDWKDVKLSLTSTQVGQRHQLPEWNNWFIGYEPERSPQLQRSAMAKAQYAEADMVLEEVTLENTGSLSQHTSISQNQLNMSFDIDLPYTINSNSKVHSVSLKDFRLDAAYEYYVAPKLNTNAYLVAQVSDYDASELLAGYANIFFDQMYVGKTYLSAENTEEDLRLNLGRDPQVAIQRKLISDKSGTKFLSSKKQQDFLYEIELKNNKNKEIAITVEDQFPLSKESSIEINLTETSKAAIDQEKGILSWNLKLKPGEIKKVRFGYQIKADKDKNLSGI